MWLQWSMDFSRRIRYVGMSRACVCNMHRCNFDPCVDLFLRTLFVIFFSRFILRHNLYGYFLLLFSWICPLLTRPTENCDFKLNSSKHFCFEPSETKIFPTRIQFEIAFRAATQGTIEFLIRENSALNSLCATDTSK